MLPNSITERLARAWPALPISAITPTVGGFSHHSALVTIGARRCVLKAAEHPPRRAALRHEARVLTLLQGTGLPAPALVGLLDDNDWTIMVMPMLPGASGVTIYAQPAPVQRAAVGALARLLASVHQSPLRPPGDTLLLANRTSQVRAQLAHHPLGTQLHAALTASLDHPAWHAGSTSLVHGDAGLHNLLWHPPAPALVDWEWAGWGNPHLDLAWVWWTLRWRQAPGALWQAFEQQYHQIVPHPRTPAGAMRALALGQIAGILTRVAGQPEAYAEWVRRAAWTLEWDA